jgi:hypothetical protein
LCIVSLLTRINDGNQVAPLTREHPRRRYTPVDYPWFSKGAVFVFNLFEGPRTRGAGHQQVAAHPQGKQARAKQG